VVKALKPALAFGSQLDLVYSKMELSRTVSLVKKNWFTCWIYFYLVIIWPLV